MLRQKLLIILALMLFLVRQEISGFVTVNSSSEPVKMASGKELEARTAQGTSGWYVFKENLDTGMLIAINLKTKTTLEVLPTNEDARAKLKDKLFLYRIDIDGLSVDEGFDKWTFNRVELLSQKEMLQDKMKKQKSRDILLELIEVQKKIIRSYIIVYEIGKSMDLTNLVDAEGKRLVTEGDNVTKTKIRNLEKELKCLEKEIERLSEE